MPLRERVVRHLTQHWRRERWLLPARSLPYPVKGGWVYLSLRNAPTYVQRVLRVYEPRKFDNIQRFLPPGGGFVDVGANAGDFTVWACAVGGPGTRVLAVEAESHNANALRRTVERNRLGEQVVVVQAAASDADGEVELLVTARSGTHSIVETELHHDLEAFRPVRRDTVPARLLDDLLRDAGLDRVDVVKIDVEGAELLVLGGATKLLASDEPMALLIDLHFGVDVDEVAELLHRSGFTIRLEDQPDTVVERIPPHTLSIVALR